jgi:hypothetical protein
MSTFQGPLQLNLRFPKGEPHPHYEFSYPADYKGKVASQPLFELLTGNIRRPNLLGQSDVEIALGISLSQDAKVEIGLKLPITDASRLDGLTGKDERLLNTVTGVANCVVQQLVAQQLLSPANQSLYLRIEPSEGSETSVPGLVPAVGQIVVNVAVSCFNTRPTNKPMFNQHSFWDPVGKTWLDLSTLDQMIESLKGDTDLSDGSAMERARRVALLGFVNEDDTGLLTNVRSLLSGSSDPVDRLIIEKLPQLPIELPEELD